ncbi:hypothetical protein ACTFIZ_004180 [Dictyostelium cf. discoideum]
MVKNITITKILFILISLNLVFSIIPPTDEYNCVLNIKNKFGTTYIGDLCGTDVDCDPQTGSVIGISILGTIFNNQKLNISDIDCLPNLEKLKTKNVAIGEGFIYYTFPILKSLTIENSFNSLIDGITQMLPNYDYFELSSPEFNGKNLNLINIGNVKKFKSSISYVNLVYSSFPSNFKTIEISIFALNYIDFSDFPRFKTIAFFFNKNFDLETIYYFPTISTDIMNITHNHDDIFGQSTEFYGHTNFKINTLNILSSISPTLDYIDFSKNVNYKTITFTNFGNFNYIGYFPIINIPKNTTIEARFGKIYKIPPISEWGNSDSHVSLQDVELLGQLPNYTGSAEFVKLSINKIEGTIDESWCNTELFVSHNLLEGTIPSCFSCYFDNPEVPGIDDPGFTMFDRFIGNTFSNHYKSIYCPTFLPRVTVLQVNPPQIKVFGKDIGYDPRNWLVNGTIGFSNVKKVLIGREYHLTLTSGSLIGVDYFSVLFKLPFNSTYTFPVVDKPPKLDRITVYSETTIAIEGRYFSSYMGHLTQSITVGGIKCIPQSTSFFQIICTTFTENLFSSFYQDFVINVGGRETIVSISTHTVSTNDVQCPNGCANNITNGICDMYSGLCICNRGYYGQDCSFASLTCSSNSNTPICSGNGICNSTNGECLCNPGYQSSDCSIPLLNCPSENKSICSGFGKCNGLTGVCTCDDNHQSSDCSIPFVKCPSINSIFDCSGYGQCQNTTGICTCDELSFSDDCSLHNCLEPNCNLNGKCDLSIGQCRCNSLYTGNDCLIPLHFVSSIIPSLETGGSAIFYGHFGDLHSDLKLTIGDLPCQITFNSSNLINCTAPPGTGIKSITVSQNHIIWSGKDIYKYISNNLKCPNDCSNNGRCHQETLECECFPNFGSFDCSGSVDNTPKSNITIDKNSSTTTIKNQEINFQIYYKQLLEVDYNGKIIKQYYLNNNWNSNKSSSPSSLDQIEHIFTQSINDGNNQCKIISNIKEILKNQEITFADTIFKLEPNSIKLTISIQNYTYQNNLNTLKLEIVTSVNQDDDNDNDCNENESNLDTSNSNDLSVFNYIKISKNNKLFSGRFINRVVSDGVSTFLSSTTTKSSLDSVIVSLNLPHCKKECVIDPDFSVLVTSKFQQNCEKDDNNKKYVIPVAVVVSVVGVAAIAAGTYVFYRKKFVENQLKIRLKIFNK